MNPRSAVQYAVKTGRLRRPAACETCGATCKLHGHHDNYDRPLDVRWLCPPCHRRWHKEHGSAPGGTERQVRLEVSRALLEAFREAARANGRSVPEELRRGMRERVAQAKREGMIA